MVKKFFDILPPQKKQKVEQRVEITERRVSKKKKVPLFFFLLLLGLLFLVMNFKFSHCDIKIYPKVEDKKIETSWKLEKGNKEVDEVAKKLPFEILEKEVWVEGEVLATKEIEKKAEGKIKLYNQYATWPETWKVGTKFMSSQGKIFVSKDRINVEPAKVDEKGKIVPSVTEVEVIALEPGEDYNIGPAKFSVLAFKGLEKYTRYWGESQEKMQGGGKVKVVQKEDIEREKSNIEQKVIAQAIDGLRREKKEIYFLENLCKVEDLKIPQEDLEGKEGERIRFQATAKVKIVGLPKIKIDEFLAKRVKEEFSEGYNILPNTETLKFTSFQFDFEKMEGNVSMVLNLKASKKINLDEIKKNVILLDIESAQEFLQKNPNVGRVQINVFPAWLQKIPKDCNISISE